MAHIGQKVRLDPIGLLGLHPLADEFRFDCLVGRDVVSNRDVTLRFSGVIHKRHDRGLHPKQVPVFGTTAHIRLPMPSGFNTAVHILKKPLWMYAGVENGVVLPQQLVARVAASGAKPVIHRKNQSLRIGGGHNRMSIQRNLGIGEFLVEAHIGIPQCFGCPFVGRSVGGHGHANQRKNHCKKPIADQL